MGRTHGYPRMPFRLPLFGPARLEQGGAPVRLRKKALAVLYYLALEGPTRRALLADLLWGHGAALQNLRAELHHLHQVLGVEAFKGQDPLALPSFVVLDRTAGEGLAMEGLEGLSPSWEEWLQGVRARLEPTEDALPVALKGVAPPFFLVLVAPPGAEPQGVARALAHEVGLPFRVGFGQGPGVFYLAPPLPKPELVGQALANRQGVYVLERSPFGEDPPFLLAARAQYPPERFRVFPLLPLSWEEAREGALRGLPFEEAARYYLRSGGWPGFLRELLALKNPEALPRRLQAQVRLEAQSLSPKARLALERLSVHPSPVPEEVALALVGEEALEELERQGWLLCAGGRYRFREEPLRRVFYLDLEEGRRRRYHLDMAVQLAHAGLRLAELYHRYLAGEISLEEVEGSKPLGTPWRERVRPGWTPVPVALGPERAPELEAYGNGVQLGRKTLCFHRQGLEGGGVRFSLEEPTLLLLEGRFYLENPLGVGTSGKAFPLLLAGVGRLLFLEGAGPGLSPWGAVLPLEWGFWRLLLEPGVYRLESLAEKGLGEFRLTFHRFAEGKEVPAFKLPRWAGPSLAGEREEGREEGAEAARPPPPPPRR